MSIDIVTKRRIPTGEEIRYESQMRKYLEEMKRYRMMMLGTLNPKKV